MIMNGLSQGGGSDSRIPVIYTTSYVGTGTSGQNNPNTLTFDFVPGLIWIYQLDIKTSSNSSINSLLRSPGSGSEDPTNFPFCMCSNLTTDYKSNKGFQYHWNEGTMEYLYIKKSEDGKTISWYYDHNNRAEEQFNSSSPGATFTYHVLALGYKEES